MSDLVAYPFFDPFYHGHLMQLTDMAREEISGASTPVVEIGGPTVRGYRLLKEEPVLPERPLITTARGTADYYDPAAVDRVVDGMHMPFDNESVGMFLTGQLSRVDFYKMHQVEAIDTADKDRYYAIEDLWYELTYEEYDRLIADPEYTPAYGLRIGILKEMMRTLKPEGLVLFEAVDARDLEVAEALGYEVLQLAQVPDVEFFDCLLKKMPVS